MTKTGQCYYFADGFLCLAESFIDEQGNTTTQVTHPSFTIESATWQDGFFVCLLNYPSWGCCYCGVVAPEESSLAELKDLILEGL